MNYNDIYNHLRQCRANSVIVNDSYDEFKRNCCDDISSKFRFPYNILYMFNGDYKTAKKYYNNSCKTDNNYSLQINDNIRPRENPTDDRLENDEYFIYNDGSTRSRDNSTRSRDNSTRSRDNSTGSRDNSTGSLISSISDNDENTYESPQRRAAIMREERQREIDQVLEDSILFHQERDQELEQEQQRRREQEQRRRRERIRIQEQGQRNEEGKIENNDFGNFVGYHRYGGVVRPVFKRGNKRFYDNGRKVRKGTRLMR
jgi:hypothetical protein